MYTNITKFAVFNFQEQIILQIVERKSK